MFRAEDEPFNAYIVKFERVYDKAAKYGLMLPDAVKACKLLKSARLGDSERQLVFSNCKKMEYKDVKASIKLIFGTTLGKSSQSSSISIKEESSLVAHSYQESRGRGSGFRGRGNFNRGRPQSRGNCYSCGSIFHFKRDCPDKNKGKDSNGDVNVVAIENQSISYLSVLVLKILQVFPVEQWLIGVAQGVFVESNGWKCT